MNKKFEYILDMCLKQLKDCQRRDRNEMQKITEPVDISITGSTF